MINFPCVAVLVIGAIIQYSWDFYIIALPQAPILITLLIYKRKTTERRTFLLHLSAVSLYGALVSSLHAFRKSEE